MKYHTNYLSGDTPLHPDTGTIIVRMVCQLCQDLSLHAPLNLSATVIEILVNNDNGL